MAVGVKHPARFTPAVFDALQSTIERWTVETGGRPKVLDPFAGVGTIHLLTGCETWAIELEPEWAEQSPVQERTLVGDFFDISNHPSALGSFDIVMTSPTYANRMSGNFVGDARGKHRYIGYAPALGRPLTEGNTAETGWTSKYRRMHERAWRRAYDLLDVGGWLVVNVKDHYRGEARQPVVAWHRATMRHVGFDIYDELEVPVPSMKFGQNRDARVEHEHIIIGAKLS